MVEQYQEDWTAFAVKRSGDDPYGCLELESVSHVAHMHHAISIARESRLRSGLVYDESRLNTERMLVNWLSPNRWRDGSRYGNIGHKFAWQNLIEGRQCFWVGVMMEYKPPAVRLLLTNKGENHLGLLAYDPTLGNGPWWYDAVSGKHYWNGLYCLEFMVEGDLPLNQAIDIDFEDHHSSFCCLRPLVCGDKSLDKNIASGRFLAGFVSQLPAGTFFPWLQNGMISGALRHAASWLLFNLSSLMWNSNISGSVEGAGPVAIPLAKAIFAAHYYARRDEAFALSSLFRSDQDLIMACRRALESHFLLPRGSFGE